MVSCDRKQAGDPTEFKELLVADITERNVPDGLVLKNGELSLADGFELVYSDDSTKALLARINTGRDPGGSTAMRCDCDGLIKVGCMVVSDPIFTCRPLLCNSCKTVLLVYGGNITASQFKNAK